eukprot:COSAG01_NODE_3400_length_6142_cov_8.459374_3_plen_231_part_00
MGRGLLYKLWKQEEGLHYSLPWLQGHPNPPRLAVYEFEVQQRSSTPQVWQDNNRTFMLGMQTRIDLGQPTVVSEIFLGCVAILQASLGLIHRWAFRDSLVEAGQGWDVRIDLLLTTWVVTAVSSWIVCRAVFCCAFRWYHVLTLLTQSAQVLVMQNAMRVHLPCYIDIRHEGNLEGWYNARKYLVQYCMARVFGLKDQLIVALTLVTLAIVSINAISSYVTYRSLLCTLL